MDLNGNSSNKAMRTDPVLYQDMKKKIENGEDFDFVLPDDKDAPRLSTLIQKRAGGEEKVDPAEVFGGR